MTHLFLQLALVAATSSIPDRLPHKVCGPVFLSPIGVVPDEVETATEIAIDTWSQILGVIPFIQIKQEDLTNRYSPAKHVKPQIMVQISSKGTGEVGTSLVLTPTLCVDSALIEISRNTVDAGESQLLETMVAELGTILGLAHPFAPTEQAVRETQKLTTGLDLSYWGAIPTFDTMMKLIGAY